jgi:transglutaminase-like putative cysteine protease
MNSYLWPLKIIPMNIFLRRVGLMSLFPLFFVISCISPYHFDAVSRSGPSSVHFIKSDMIVKGMGLKQKFPNEEFYGLGSEVLVEFYLEGDEKAIYSYPKAAFRSQEKKMPAAGDVSEEDLLMSTPVKARVTYFNSVLSLEDWNVFADVIPYTRSEKVANLMVSYAADNNEWFFPTVIDKSLEDGGIFYSDARMKAFQTGAFTTGTRISYSYTVTYDNINYLANLFFNEHYPVAKKTITFAVPQWLDIRFLEKNFGSCDIQKIGTRPIKSEIAQLRDFLGEEKGNEKASRKRKKSNAPPADKISYVSFEAVDLRASRREPGSAGPTHNLPHVVVNTRKYTDKEGNEKKVMSDVGDLYGWYRTLVDRVRNDTAYIREKALEIVKGKENDRDKVEAVFYWVQDNIRYIAFEDGIAGFMPDACQKVYDNRYGDCKGMANLTAQMLRSIGFDARLTWVGTRRIAYDYSIPSIAVDNHMICTVVLDGKRFFLDPTESFISFGDYAHRIQGRQVLIENGKDYIIDTIPDLSYERNKSEKTESLKLENRELTGKASEIHRGESKTFLLYALNSIKSDRKSNFVERFLSGGNINLKIKSIQHNEISERSRNIEFSYDMKVLNHVIRNEGETYINAEWDYEMQHLVMDSSRLTDYDFGSKVFISKETRIALPSGSAVKYLPSPLAVDNGYFKLNLAYRIDGNELIYTKSILFPEGKIPRSYQAEWNRTQKRLNKFYTDYAIITN